MIKRERVEIGHNSNASRQVRARASNIEVFFRRFSISAEIAARNRTKHVTRIQVSRFRHGF